MAHHSADLMDLDCSAKWHLVSRYRRTTLISLTTVTMQRHVKTNNWSLIPERNILHSCLQTSCRFLFSARLLLEKRADRAGLWGKIVGIASGLSFRFQGHDPSSSVWSLTVSSKQSASKCSEHRRGFFGSDVLPTAWIQARRNLSSFGKIWKLILVSFLFFACLLQPKATQCGILTVFSREPAKRSNHDTSSAHSALRAI
jgi:hypothetical protein